ncbi:hypothetical protein [Nonomuraea aurantiaca]|uniref:hypothetical protein n=1 Tax=Nonomuraea aurantiaca TaxID=2878562 RepID=UPI001CDA15DC|nr:hypothetical protein [Nonomuraea aurantiaca]MCA2230120.1 hypothetical protein [Nonomuraea aurantiaca]
MSAPIDGDAKVMAIAGLLTVAASAASAADTTTDLGVTSDSYTADLAVGGGRVFVPADDRIIVADTGGNLTGVVTGLSGVRGATPALAASSAWI